VGYLNRFEGVMANFSLRPDQARPKPGPVGLISQSGGVGSTLLSRLMEHGVGVGLFATTGNECHMTASDLLQFFIEQPEMSIVGVFAETIGRPEVFVRAAQRAAELDKPIIAMRPPKSEAAARAALAHTGSTVVSPEVFDAVCDQYGVLRVPSIDNFVDLSVILQNGRRMRGRKVAVVTMSGGAGVLIAGEAQEQGLEVNVLGPSTEQKIAAITPPFAGTKNPVDTTPALNPWSAFRDVIEILLQDAEIDVVLVYIWGPENQLAEMVIAAYGATDKPVATIATENPEGMSAKGVPSFGDPARAARALVALHKISVRRPFAPEPAFSPDVARRERVRTILSVRSMVSGAEARRAISEYGIAFIDETSYATEDEDVAGSGIEFALGMLRDPDFGPMVALRVGRSSAPLAQVLLRAPVGQAQVLAAVERLTDPRVERFSQSVHIGWREQLVSPAGVNALGAVIVQSPPGEHQTPGRDNRGPTPRLG
jgi:acyl-CoA synthetase (NDP forming)